MKRSNIAVLIGTCALVIASLACGAATGGTDEESPTAAPKESPTEAPADGPAKGADMPALEDNSDEVDKIIASGETVTLYGIRNESDRDPSYEPGVDRFTVDMPPDTQVDLGPGWCTKTEDDREDNKAHFEPSLIINGEEIPSRDLTYFEWETDDGSFCFSYDIIGFDWPEGKHVVEETFTFDESVNDGWDDYPAGDYTTEYTVTVSKDAAVPAGDPSSDDCLTWDEVTTSMKDEVVCFRGVITKFDQSRQLGTRYSFSDDSDSVFLYSIKYEIIDPNTGKTIAPGTCVEIGGPIRVEGERPAVALDPIMDDDSGDSGYFSFFDDPESCE
jgi:hypothetical protein